MPQFLANELKDETDGNPKFLPSNMHINHALMNKLRWGIPYPSPIACDADALKIFSNKARVDRLIKQWNRWCDQDYSQPLAE